jgi:hypothetical protein
MAVRARLSVGSVVRTGSVCGGKIKEIARFEMGVAHHYWKMNRRRLSWVHVTGSSRILCYVGLDACGMSIAVVRLACTLVRAQALVAK